MWGAGGRTEKLNSSTLAKLVVIYSPSNKRCSTLTVFSLGFWEGVWCARCTENFWATTPITTPCFLTRKHSSCLQIGRDNIQLSLNGKGRTPPNQLSPVANTLKGSLQQGLGPLQTVNTLYLAINWHIHPNWRVSRPPHDIRRAH